MTSYTRLRALSLIPALYALFGLAVVVGTVQARQYVSPMRGYAGGSLVILASALTVRELWLARSRAALWPVMSGALTVALLLLLGWIFPFVDASSEPPSLIARIWYPSALVLTILLALTSSWIAEDSLRSPA